MKGEHQLDFDKLVAQHVHNSEEEDLAAAERKRTDHDVLDHVELQFQRLSHDVLLILDLHKVSGDSFHVGKVIAGVSECKAGVHEREDKIHCHEDCFELE